MGLGLPLFKINISTTTNGKYEHIMTLPGKTSLIKVLHHCSQLKAIALIPKKLKYRIPYNSAVHSLAYTTKTAHGYLNTCTWMFIEALLTTTKRCK